jgi:hypothetical protein
VADLYKYGVAVHLYKPIIKRAVVDFAVSADWTPAAGDVKISKDGGAAANVTNLPVAITMGNTAMWDYSLTATEMQAAKVRITVADSATKAVEDTFFEVDTFGNASAQFAVDLSDVVRFGLTALPNVASGAAGALPTTGTGANQINVDGTGCVDANVVKSGTAGAGTVVLPRYTGTAQAGSGAATLNLANGTTALQCQQGDLAIIRAGTGAGESNFVQSTSGMGGANPVAVMVANWQNAIPDGTSQYEIIKTGGLVPQPVSIVNNRPDVNIGSVRGTTVNSGVGTPASPWGP